MLLPRACRFIPRNLGESLAHELNQPLTTIGTYARTVLRRQESQNLTPEAITEASTEIAREAERAGGIVQRIRHFAKKREATREAIKLADIAEEARRLIVGMLARPPEVVIENRLTDRCQVLADGAQIQQVLLNLIKNLEVLSGKMSGLRRESRKRGSACAGAD